MGSTNEFYLTVDSKDSLKYFKTNKCEEFYVKLPYLLNLSGEWCVSVNQIWFDKMMYNILNCALRITDQERRVNSLDDDVKPIDTSESIDYIAYIPDGSYKDISDIINVLNSLCEYKSVDLCEFSYDPILCKVKVVISEGISIIMNPELCDVLGFNLGVINKSTAGDNCVNLHPVDRLIYIYTDIITQQMFGNSAKKVLKILDISNADFGQTVYDNNISNYARVAINRFDVIHFEIRDVNNHRIKTENGHVVIQLHFRKV